VAPAKHNKKTNAPYKPVKPCKPDRMRQLPRRSNHLSTIQARTMTDEDMIALVQEYFAGVDNEDIDRVLSTLTEDCRFTVETHQVELIGHGEIKGMFERLWQNHSAVRHHAFTYVPSAVRGTTIHPRASAMRRFSSLHRLRAERVHCAI
jgi:hypothetical protein